jgi:hypothetical protein
MAKLGYKVLFVSPTNILCKELVKDYNIDAITINKFFGFGVNEGNNFIKQFDSTDYDCIIFDEIYFYNVSNLMKVYNFIQNNNNKIILATGDIDQLESIEIVSNVQDDEQYIDNCINYVFSNEMFKRK